MDLMNETPYQLALQKLTTKEQIFAGKLLKAILENQRTEIKNLNQAKLDIIAKLINSFTSTHLKIIIIESLHSSQYKELIPQLSDISQNEFFEHWSQGEELDRYFKYLTSQDQNRVLTHLFHTDRNRFSRLKPLNQKEANYADGIKIESATSTPPQREAEIESLMNQLTNVKTPLKEILNHAKKIDNEYEIQDIENIYLKIIHNFKRLNIELNSPQSFTQYLNIFNIFETRILTFPIFKKAITPIIDRVLYTTAQIEDINWILTILSQIPHNCLNLTIQYLRRYETIREFKKRNLYGKLKGTLEKELNNPKAAAILAVWKEA